MYDHLEARLHDVFWETEGQSAELLLLEEFLGNHPGTALELGCGSGRLLLPLLENGYFIEGLDNSPEMLSICREQSGELDPVLHHGDIRDFDTGAIYSAITIPAFTLQFIPPGELAPVLSNIRKHLHPGGGLYITTFIPWAEIAGELEEGEWYADHESKLKNGHTARCQTRFQIQRMSQRLTREHRYEIIADNGEILETSDSTHHLHWIWPNEFTRLLEYAGFQVDRVIGDFDPSNPMDQNSHILTFYCHNTAE